MKYLLLTICFSMTPDCYGQEPVVRLGGFAGELLKINFYENSGIKSIVPAMTSLGLALQVRGTSESSCTFLLPVELTDDRATYTPTAGVKLVFHNEWISVNPTLIVPSSSKRIWYTLGIGSMVSIGRDIGLLNSTQGAVQTLPGSAFDSVTNSSRDIIPFLSAGLLFQATGHWQVQVMLSQPLLNYYDDNASMTFYVNGLRQYLQLSYLPTCFGARIYYFIR